MPPIPSASICRVRLASVNQELRKWSAEHGHELWSVVELGLTGGSYAHPKSWAGALWLQKHGANVRALSLAVHQVRCCCWY